MILLAFLAFCGCAGSKTESNATTANHDDHGEHGDHGDHEEHGDHKEHEAPKDFATALKQLKDMKVLICKAFADGSPDDAHDQLHDVGKLLEKMPELAAEGGDLAAEKLTEIDQAVEELFDGFGQLDGTLHGGDAVDVAELEKQLTQSIESLEMAAK